MEAMNAEATQRKSNRHLRHVRENLLLPVMPIQFDDESSARKQDVDEFIADRFCFHYQAEVTHFLPYLLSTKKECAYTAAMGFQPAGTVKPLFLEQYLSLTIEEEIGQKIHQNVDRSRIAEVGNLTSVHRGTSQLLFVLIIAVLHKAGFEWSVFTATTQVQQLLARLSLKTITLCEANPEKLLDKQQSWGSYYDDKPKVLIGNLTDAYALLSEHQVISFMLKNYEKTITDIAQKIKR